MKIPTTARGCVIHVTKQDGRRIRITKDSPSGHYVVTFNRQDARMVADAIHDVLEAA